MKKTAALLLAFLLTGALVLFCISYTGRQAIAPAMNGDGAQVSDGVIRQEQQLAVERVTELAELYGFEAEPAAALVSEDTLRELNGQASRWWSVLLQDGEVGNRISWDSGELEQAIRFTGREDDFVRMVLPMRTEPLRLGMQKVPQKVDTVSLLQSFMEIPWAALALCALLAGLIALLKSSTFRDPLQYIGSALGGAALVMAVLIILCLCAGIRPMILEASEGLAIQYDSMVSGAAVRAGLLTATMAAGCILCLAGNRKNRKAA